MAVAKKRERQRDEEEGEGFLSPTFWTWTRRSFCIASRSSSVHSFALTTLRRTSKFRCHRLSVDLVENMILEKREMIGDWGLSANRISVAVGELLGPSLPPTLSLPANFWRKLRPTFASPIALFPSLTRHSTSSIVLTAAPVPTPYVDLVSC